MTLNNAGTAALLTEFHQHFTGFRVNPEDYGLNLTATTGVSIARLDQSGGWLRIPLGASDAHAGMGGTPVIWQPNKGVPIVVRARIKTTLANKSSIFFGLSDADSETNAVVIENEDGTLNTVPANAAGFLLEGEQSLNWHSVAVKNNADAPLMQLGGARWEMKNQEPKLLQMEVNEKGTCRFYINGNFFEERKELIRPDIAYSAVFSADGRGSSYGADLDEIYVCQPSVLEVI